MEVNKEIKFDIRKRNNPKFDKFIMKVDVWPFRL